MTRKVRREEMPLKKNIREHIVHGLVSLLLAAGLLMPILGMMDSTFISFRILALSAGFIILIEISFLHKISAWAVSMTGLAAALIWLLGSNGAEMISDYLLAVTLRIRGIETALPLISEQAGIITGCFVAILSFAASFRRLTWIPSAVLCIFVTALIWLSNRPDLLPWLMPAMAAVLTMIMTARYEDTRTERVLPWAVLIVVLSFLISLGGTAIQPLKEKADELRQAVMDRLFFTEARDVFSLYSAGFSPQGPDQLGGKPDPDPSPVMEVSAARDVYLRGTVYDQYTGHAWKNTAVGRRLLWQSDRMKSERKQVFNEDLPPDDIQNTLSDSDRVTIRMLRDSASTLFVPQRIRELTPGADLVPYFSNSSEIFATRNLRAGDTYSAVAPLYLYSDPGIENLIEMCSMRNDSFWDSMPDIYKALPDHLEIQVYNLANSITEGADTDYRKAMAILTWIQQNCRYTLEVDEHPDNIDFVTSFLLDTRKGYCTYFATAMTVLCRMAGLPARYVEGYLARTDGNGTSVVTGVDAHAWTEVYFKGFGWLTFDAVPGGDGKTGSQQIPDHSGNEPAGSDPVPENTPSTSPEPVPDNTPDRNPSESVPPETTPAPDNKEGQQHNTPDNNMNPDPKQNPSEQEMSDPEGRHDNKLLIVFLVLFILIILLIIRFLITSPHFREKRAVTDDEKVEIWAQEIFDLLASENIIRKDGETPIRFTKRVDDTALFSTSLVQAGICLSVVRYSSKEAGKEDVDEMRDTAILLKGEISKPARMKYWCRRIFPTESRRYRML